MSLKGRGFAVGADEVINLAVRTSEATAQIRKRIENIQDNSRLAVDTMESGVEGVEQGMRVAEEGAKDDGGITDMVSEMLATIADINQRGSVQLESAKEVATITTALQLSLAAVRSSTSSVDNSADRLEKLVGKFQVTGR